MSSARRASPGQTAARSAPAENLSAIAAPPARSRKESSAKPSPAEAEAARNAAPRSLQGRLRFLADRMFGLDARSLALFRMALALVLICDLMNRSHDLRAHYTDQGVMPSLLVSAYQGRFFYLTLHTLHNSLAVQAALFLLAGGIALAMLVGYRTRAATILSWFLLISLHNRNPMVLTGGDNILRMLAFWAMFLPLGACFSVDRALRPPETPVPTRIVTVGSLAFMVQMWALYYFSALLKTGPNWRVENSAVYYALSVEQYATPLGKMLLPYTGLLTFLSWFTFRMEWYSPLLIHGSGFFGPLRTAIVALFIGFHLSLMVTLELGLFPVTCAVGWLALLPGWFWEQAARVRARIPLRLGALRDAPLFQKRPGLLASLHPQAAYARPHWLTQGIAAFFLIFILCWNIRTLDFKRHSQWFPERWNWIAEIARVDQHWGLFAPDPMKDYGWILVVAQLKDGTEMDLLQQVSPISWEPPPLISRTYINDRWRRYLMNLLIPENQGHRWFYAQYLFRLWSPIYNGDRAIQRMNIYYVKRDGLPNRRLSDWQRVHLITVDFPEQPAAPASSAVDIAPQPAVVPPAPPQPGR